jgi:hypothetical protein
MRSRLPPHPATVIAARPAFTTVPSRAPHVATVAQPKLHVGRPPAPRRFASASHAVLQRSSIGTSLSATTVAASFVDAKSEKLGQFTFEVSFSVSPAAKGYIVQHVVRSAVISERWGKQSKVLSDMEIDTFSTMNPDLSAWSEYREVFEVDSSGDSVDNDQFSFTQMDLQNHPTLSHQSRWTTDGTFTVTGDATYYAGKWPKKAFNTGSTGNPANGLPWSLTDPTSSLPSAASNTVQHAATVTWVGQKKGHTTLDCTIGGVSVYSETI